MNKIDKTVLILQARMGSNRLPGKSMLDLAGAPLVSRIIERVKRCKSINDIILAIPGTTEDKILSRLAEKNNIRCFVGSENDLVDRYYQAAKQYDANTVVRLPADNVAPEPTEIDKIVALHQQQRHPTFCTNLAQINNSGYPDGIGAEVFDFNLLEWAWKNCIDPHLREHPHLNFLDYQSGVSKHPALFKVKTLLCPKEFARPEIVLDVNTKEEYELMSEMYTDLYSKNPEFSITDIIKWHDARSKQNE